jgi:type I restriction enzyme M protein
MGVAEEIGRRLKNTKEQKTVVGPLVGFLVKLGWNLDEIVFGKKEWLVPKTPSEHTKREKYRAFSGFPVDIAVFDDVSTTGDPRHLLFLIECKQPDEQAGMSQLESYFAGEPHARLGVWANNPDPTAPAAFVYRRNDGSMLVKRLRVGNFPRPGEAIKPDAATITFNDLVTPSESVFRSVVQDLLDKIVIRDANVTRREEQLGQLCNLLLLKLESDKQAKSDPTKSVFLRPLESPSKTAKAIRGRFRDFVRLYPETFTLEKDNEVRFSDETVHSCVESLAGLRLIDLGLSSVAVAFQVLRSEALKQKEGQYFTPLQVIEAGVRLLNIEWEDIVLDPACGTGGFLLQSIRELEGKYTNMRGEELSRWAQTHIFGIDKDAIGVKLTKAIMQIAGDGSAHCARGDSILVHKWPTDYPHLTDGNFKEGRFSVVVTNPPFGKNLTIAAEDSRLSKLEIGKAGTANYQEMVIGLVFLERAYELLKPGGRIGIVLPETYFFSPDYEFLWRWLRTRLRPLVVVNVPMEAFQGFCRAKTNFHVFEKVKDGEAEAESEVVFLNPRTCGIYKSGAMRFKIDPNTGKRTSEIDNELIDHVNAYVAGGNPPGIGRVPLKTVYEKKVLVPTYWDNRYNDKIRELLASDGLDGVTLGALQESRIIEIRGGHGSPGNDQRSGSVPYIKLSDIRALRINVNPTNLVPEAVAKSLWGGASSGLQSYDLITPNRASSNIGEFSILLPGEERVVLTKEMFVIRVVDSELYDPFYFLWAFSLKAVREQWRRIALMQTNREDCGQRYREVLIPKPKSKAWALEVSQWFRNYFTTLAEAKAQFIDRVRSSGFEHVASVMTAIAATVGDDGKADDAESNEEST